jgi:hypothetical protein
MQQEAELLRAESDYQTFLTENPEFKTDKALRSEVQALLERNPQLDLETAYWAAKGKRRRGKGSAAGLDKARPEADPKRPRRSRPPPLGA